MRPALPAALSHHPLLWRGRRHDHGIPATPTGYPKLDRYLPGGGWPVGALTELLAATPGTGEFTLLLPALAKVTSCGQWAVLIDPPWTPYPPAMRGHDIDLEHMLVIHTSNEQESLWACEQALRGVRGGAVLAWPGNRGRNPGFTGLRRLQLAARAGHKAAFMFRPLSVAGDASPAALRLHLHADEHGLHVRVLKCQGARPGEALRIRRPHQPAALTDAHRGTTEPSGAHRVSPGMTRPDHPSPLPH